MSVHNVPWTVRVMGAGFRELGRVAPTVTADILSTLLTTTWRPRRPRREEETLRTARRLSLPFPQNELHALQWGQGPRVVALMHGWNGRCTQLGAFVDPLCRLGFRVAAVDAQGHGRSPGHRASLANFADSLLGVKAALGPLHAVIAHSVGSLSTMLAQAVGLDAQRLVLISCPSGPHDWVNDVVAQHRLGDDVKRHIIARLDRKMARWPTIRGAEVARAMTVPTLFMADRDDRFAPWEVSRDIARSAPSSSFVTTTGLGHHRIIRAPSVVDSAVRFLRE